MKFVQCYHSGSSFLLRFLSPDFCGKYQGIVKLYRSLTTACAVQTKAVFIIVCGACLLDVAILVENEVDDGIRRNDQMSAFMRIM